MADPGTPIPSPRRCRLRVGLTVAASLTLAAILPAGAQTPPPTEPGADLVVGVLTMGQGDLVYELFGHNAIWIHDPARGTNRVYNYGVFDFDSPGYWSRFVQGDWLYQLAVDDLDHTLWLYRALNRSVWLQVLNLTPAQKRELRDFLEWNAQPRHREYLYDYYRDNCSTRVRDVLDRILGGALARASEGVPTGTTYRWHTERLLAGDPFSYTGILVGLGPAADRDIDAWEEMFLPFAVQEQLRGVRVQDASGRPVPLVAREETLFATVRPPPLEAPPVRVHWYLLAGLAAAGIIVVLSIPAAGRGARRGLIVTAMGWAALSGILGLLLLGLWTLTNHTIAYRNASLLQMNPLALALLVLLPAAALGARWTSGAARVVAGLLVALSAAGFLLWLLPWFPQRNGAVVALALPVHAALFVAVTRLGRAATKVVEG